MGDLAPPVWIDTDRALKRLVEHLATQSAIAVDTEANSMFAYRECVCLIQISTSERDYLVDPLADLDIARLATVFADGFVAKVFHDAEFDLLVLRRAFPFEFVGLFDTKVAASALGLPNVGLAALLDEWLGVALDKKYQRSNWGQRPLTDGQIDYARLDTHYLLELAAELRAELHRIGEPCTLEVAAEMRRLVRESWPEPREFDPEDYVRVRGADRLAEPARQRLRALFACRDELAREADVPPFKILGNDLLVALASAGPKTHAQLAKVHGAANRAVQRHERAILDCLRAVDAAEDAGDESTPRPTDRRGGKRPSRRQNGSSSASARGDALGREGRAAYERLRQWRKDHADSLCTDASLLLPKDMMKALARLTPSSVTELRSSGVIEPWRVDYYGAEILAALRGGSPNGDG